MVKHVSLEEQTIVQLECEPQNQTKYYTHTPHLLMHLVKAT